MSARPHRAGSSIATLVVALIGQLSATVASGEAGRTWEEVSVAALDYLALPHRESGADVVVALEIVAAATGAARAVEVAAIRRAALDPDELETWAALLGAPKPALATLETSVAPESDREPRISNRIDFDPTTADIPDCMRAVVACDWPESCAGYVRARASGRDLTHQAAAILIAGWARCPFAADLLVERQRLGGELAAEARRDHSVSDLYAERLAMLAHLGFTDAIEPVRIAGLVAAQLPDGGWAPEPGGESHPHTTALALWALALIHAAGQWP